MTTPTNMTSTNWSGAVVQAGVGQSFSGVSAEWTVPTVSQVPLRSVATSDAASWVGLDGFSSNDVAQAGIQQLVTTGANGHSQVTDYAWDEWYPAGSNNVSSALFKVDPGDTVKITVETAGVGSTTASFLFKDVTTGQAYQAGLTAPAGTSLLGDSAEWVVETPEFSNGFATSQPPLADFLATPVVFQDAVASYSDGAAASLSGADTISMESYGDPGIPNYTPEAYGSVSAATDSVTVTEDNYWASSTDPFLRHGFYV